MKLSDYNSSAIWITNLKSCRTVVSQQLWFFSTHWYFWTCSDKYNIYRFVRLYFVHELQISVTTSTLECAASAVEWPITDTEQETNRKKWWIPSK